MGPRSASAPPPPACGRHMIALTSPAGATWTRRYARKQRARMHAQMRKFGLYSWFRECTGRTAAMVGVGHRVFSPAAVSHRDGDTGRRTVQGGVRDLGVVRGQVSAQPDDGGRGPGEHRRPGRVRVVPRGADGDPEPPPARCSDHGKAAAPRRSGVLRRSCETPRPAPSTAHPTAGENSPRRGAQTQETIADIAEEQKRWVTPRPAATHVRPHRGEVRQHTDSACWWPPG